MFDDALQPAAASRCVLIALVLVAAVPAGSAAAGGFPHFGPGCARADFTSGNTKVGAELCRATHGVAAVVVLHGCGGFSTFDHRLASDLPAYGISTLDVDYFA